LRNEHAFIHPGAFGDWFAAFHGDLLRPDLCRRPFFFLRFQQQEGSEMTAAGELVRLEVWPTRKTRVILEKLKPAWLLAMHPGVSFFYRVEVNHDTKTLTPDPSRARDVFRESCRWAAKA